MKMKGYYLYLRIARCRAILSIGVCYLQVSVYEGSCAVTVKTQHIP